jgi:hypothetical protein
MIDERACPRAGARRRVEAAAGAASAYAGVVDGDLGAELAEEGEQLPLTSVMSGTRCRTIGCSVSSVAHSTGRTAFLFAEE